MPVASLSEAQAIPRFAPIARRLVTEFPYFAKRCLKIRPKKGGLIRFELNHVQQMVHARLEEQRRNTGKVRALVLKARQPGISTYVEGRFFHQVMNRAGVQAYVLTHMQDATDNVFEFTRRFYDKLPEAIKPITKAANTKELKFSTLDSGVEVSTAGARGAGRSYTIQYFHGSEVAFWQNAPEHMAGVMQAVPNAIDTEIILESTANGVGGLFYDMCQDAQQGNSEYQLIFVPWYTHAEYREPPPPDWRPNEEFMDYATAWRLEPDQLYWMWRTNHSMAVAHNRDPEKIAWVFRQEYPASVAEAFQIADFDAFIRPEVVVRARKATIADQSDFPLILGVDTAHGGGAKTHIVDRRGRCAGHLVDESLDTADTMEIVGRIARLIDQHRPDAVFIDTTNNPAIYDRLRELGHKQVQPVIFGSGAHRGDRYQNKRVEMADDCAKWLEQGADIPDSDEWQADLCATGTNLPDSLGRMKLEEKASVIKRTRRTMDRFDALLTTFAEPVCIPAPRTLRVLPKQANSAYRPQRWR